MRPSIDDFVMVETPEPHRLRTKQIIDKHPEVRNLIGKNPNTIWVILLCVAAQVTIGYYLRNQHWYWIIAAAWLVGAFFSHTLFVCIHETAHNLLFKGRWGNVIAAVVANLPSIVPSAVSFRNFHLKHHAFQGVHELDADLPDWYEARMIKNYSIGKAAWMLLFPVFQTIRTIRCREVATVDKYVAVNIIAQIIFDVAIVYFFGWGMFLYLIASLWFSVGFHPLGARWIQEHFLVLDKNQETYSYYGPLNVLNMNVGFHNEHHDMPSIPWNNLPKLKATAPEFYESLKYHKSFTTLWLRFLFSQEISMFSRITRKNRGQVSLQDMSTPDLDILQTA